MATRLTEKQRKKLERRLAQEAFKLSTLRMNYTPGVSALEKDPELSPDEVLLVNRNRVFEAIGKVLNEL